MTAHRKRRVKPATVPHRPNQRVRPKPRFRVLAKLPVAISVDAPQPIGLRVDAAYPQLTIRPICENPLDQMNEGGCYASIEFEEDQDDDILHLLDVGVAKLREALSAIALVVGAPLVEIEPVQLLETTVGKRNQRFIFVLTREAGRWPTPIRADAITSIRKVLSHWDDPDRGYRLRRAGYLYAEALSSTDVLKAFQLAWSGLEALEKPLADEVGIPPGSETVTAKCSVCGHEYTYRRTVLAGVRALVYGELHELERTEAAVSDWKKMGELRNDLTHSLRDLPELEARAHDEISAVLHYLHDASAHLAHVHALEVSPYQALLPITRAHLCVGTLRNAKTVPLDRWEPLFVMSEARWVEDAEHGFVPEFAVENSSGGQIGGTFFALKKPLVGATIADLEKARWEGSPPPREAPADVASGQ